MTSPDSTYSGLVPMSGLPLTMPVRRPLLELRSVAKAYGSVGVLKDINLSVHDGEFVAVLGPSGCGKTTALRIIGGFCEPTCGQVILDDNNITDFAINRRPFNTVFQDYALFPHMNVVDNVAYGLMVRGRPRLEIVQKVEEVLRLVQLSGLRDRFPAQLSGGQRQRVALARAIICRPRLILLDEPLAALDVDLRKQMQDFLKAIQREIRTTFLFVTHDQDEAMAVADRICVMEGGKVQQFSSPWDLYYRPVNEFVARFFGENNLVEGRLGAMDGKHRSIETGWGRLICTPDECPHHCEVAIGSRAILVVRPEDIEPVTVDNNRSAGTNQVNVVVTTIEFSGPLTIATLRARDTSAVQEIRMRLPSRREGIGVTPGQPLRVTWRADSCRLLPA